MFYRQTLSVTEHPWLQNAKKAPNVPLGDVVKSRLKQFSLMNRFKRKALRVSGLSRCFSLLSVVQLFEPTSELLVSCLGYC